MSEVTHREVLGAVGARLTAAGWRKRAGAVLTYPVAPQVTANLSLANATRYGAALAPSLALRHDVVEQVIARILGRTTSWKDVTVARNLGYLRPEPGYLTIPFDSLEHLDRDVTEVVELVQGPGLAWARDHAELPALLAALRERPYVVREYAALPVAVVCALLGRPQEGREELAAAGSLVPPDSLAGRERRQTIDAYDAWLVTP